MAEELVRPDRAAHDVLALVDLLNLFGDCREIFGEVSNEFRKAYPMDIRALQVALENEDCVGVGFYAHKIRSSVSVFSCERATAIAQELELQAKLGNLGNLPKQVQDLEEILGSVSTALCKAENLFAEGR